jgi:hypothetical protein
LLKMRGLRQSFFGTRPALNITGTRKEDRGICEPGARSASQGVRLPSFSSGLITENPEFEEIQAHDKHRGDASTIRQKVPTPSSSTA